VVVPYFKVLPLHWLVETKNFTIILVMIIGSPVDNRIECLSNTSYTSNATSLCTVTYVGCLRKSMSVLRIVLTLTVEAEVSDK
jgi:hypothetical protein